jgi:hypothetical protein
MEFTFKETQAFRQPLLWIPLIALFVFVMALQVGFTVRSGRTSNLHWLGAFLSGGVFLIVYILLFISRLEVTVSSEGLLARFYPFEMTFRRTGWEDMTSLEAVTISPMRVGGWGLRLGPNGKTYIVSGNLAVKIGLKNGKNLVVGTSEPERLLVALKQGKES